MPEATGLELLVRKNEPTDEEWLSLIEARREVIKPHLKSFTLPKFGDLECLRNENFRHKIFLDLFETPKCRSLSLQTQGLFFIQPWSAIERIPGSGYCAPPGGVNVPDGTMLVWGLARSGPWVLATIKFNGEAGYKNRGYERARTVDIIETDLKTIVAQTKEKPQRIWEELGAAIKSFAEHRRVLYNEALNLARMIEIEELALSSILKKGK